MKDKIRYILMIILCLFFTCFIISKIENNNKTYINNLDYKLQTYEDKTSESYKTISMIKEDTVSSFHLFFVDIQESNLVFGYFLIIILVYVFTLWWVCKLLNTKTFSYFYIREKNSHFIRNILLKYYKYALIVPISLGVIFLYGVFCKNFHVDSFILEQTRLNETILKNSFIFFILLVIKCVLEFTSYINMAIVMARVNKKFITSVFSSALLVLALEFFLGNYGHIITNSYWIEYIRVWSDIQYDITMGIWAPLLFPIIMFIISLILVIISFKNKEKLLLDYETKD